MDWIISNLGRFYSEKALIEQLLKDVDWLTSIIWLFKDGNMQVEFDICAHGRTYEGKLIYPANFPDSPPDIRPRNSKERWTGHQYGNGGSLCLEWRSDNWNPQISGADMLRSTYTLLNIEQHPELPNRVPSAHHDTLGQRLRSDALRLLFTSDTELAILNSAKPSWSIVQAKTIYHETYCCVSLINSITTPESVERLIQDIPEGISNMTPVFKAVEKGLLFRHSNFDKGVTFESVDHLYNALRDTGFNILDITKTNSYTIIILCGDNLQTCSAFSIRHTDGETPTISNLKVINASAKANRLHEEHEQLKNTQVGIIGLGSVGSKVAISLARSGIRNFILVDDDFVKPENMIRNELAWDSIGMHKVDAVRERLSLIAPGVKVESKSYRIAGQESSGNMSKLIAKLDTCQILVDATANSDVFLVLAGISRRNKIPLCWAEVFAGGYAGLIARSRPDMDPNPLAVRSAIHQFCNEQPKAPYQNLNSYDGDEETPLIAYDSEVTQISSALTQLTIDTALGRNPSIFPYPAYLIGLHQNWIIQQPFDTRPIEALGDGWDMEEEQISECDKKKALADFIEILKKSS